MFEHLEQFRGVIVTGAHRSGATICGRMIAHDLDRPYTTESQVQQARGRNIDRDHMKQWIARQPGSWVLHGATCYRWIEDLQGQGIAVVFVRRPVAEIHASQKRAGRVIDDPAEKLERWYRMSSESRIAHPFTVDYADLRSHPLWSDDREGWDVRQILPDETAFDTRGGRCAV